MTVPASPRKLRALAQRRVRAHCEGMAYTPLPGGTFTLADDLVVTRFGYGAMQLAGPNVMGPPADHDEAIRVLRESTWASPTSTPATCTDPM